MRSFVVCVLCEITLVAPSHAANCYGNGQLYSDPWNPGAASAWTWPCSQSGQGLTGTYLEDRSTTP